MIMTNDSKRARKADFMLLGILILYCNMDVWIHTRVRHGYLSPINIDSDSVQSCILFNPLKNGPLILIPSNLK